MMCEGSFTLSRWADLKVSARRVWGYCRLCQQRVGGIVLGEGLVRMNWHETKEAKEEGFRFEQSADGAVRLTGGGLVPRILPADEVL